MSDENSRTDGVTSLEEIKAQQAADEALAEKRIVEEENRVLREQVELLRGQRHYVVPMEGVGNTLLFALISCTHYGSLYARADAVRDFYHLLHLEGVKLVLHCGDVLDGHGIYRGQVFEQKAPGAEAQLKVLEEEMPREDGVETAFISGNHDYSFYKENGSPIWDWIAARTGWKYVGRERAWVELMTPSGLALNVGLSHPGGGTAYAVSYKSQKHVESIPGGKKPDVLAIGHYHKADWMPMFRNVQAFQVGCFDPRSGIRTSTGLRELGSLSIGDMVLTHNNRYQRVLKVLDRPYVGDWISIEFGRKGSDSTCRCTGDHPILAQVSGEKEPQWTSARDIVEGMRVLVPTKGCSVCGAPIPYYFKMCSQCNAMDVEEVRRVASINRHGCYYGGKYLCGTEHGRKHLRNVILPSCDRLRKEGWLMVPVGGGIIPDAVGFKDGRCCLFEFESCHAGNLQAKKRKYDDADWLDGIDVHWIDASPRKAQHKSGYELHPSGFALVPVVRVQKKQVERKERVMNLEVEGDNSYVCQNLVVHNCFQSQTPHMAAMPTDAHVGGWIVKAVLDKERGMVSRVSGEFVAFYEPTERVVIPTNSVAEK